MLFTNIDKLDSRINLLIKNSPINLGLVYLIEYNHGNITCINVVLLER